ncbi:MAG: glycosyltransferase [Cytophagaceae bacterium]|nr:glycosyltransferase [Gemmatimonadaceae bacterium]
MTRTGAGIVHVDLSTLPRDGATVASGHRAFVVVWWRDVPLGSFVLGPEEQPLTPAALLERAAVATAPAVGHWLVGGGFEASAADIPLAPRGVPAELPLGQPLAQLADATRSAPFAGSLGVIVCTRDRPDALARCLDAIAASQRPADVVLVVDNAPGSSATREIVAARGGVRYLLEPEPGLSRARNAGLRECRTDIVAFTDDDVLVHPAWTTCLAGALVERDIVAMTGLVLPASLDGEAEWMFETTFGGFSQGYRPFDAGRPFLEATRGIGVPVWRLGAGANMAFRREDLLEAGGFDERLGAGASGCSEDSEAWYRILARGRTIRYDPRAVVFHAHRGDLESLRRQMYLYMRGHVAALFVQFERHGHWGNLRRLALTLPRYYAGRLLRARGAHTAGTLGAEMRGAAAGIGYYLQHRGDPRSTRLMGSTTAS